MVKTFQLERFSCPTCATKIEIAMKRTAGVKTAEVFFMSSKVKIEYDDSLVSDEEIKTKLKKLGYPVIKEV
jgi:copper chaperone CopZ